ncbi:spindle and kinetochore-associated protein 3 isoform 2-T4 [Anomaloglossus baeobatrachus]|uniref:spindle and kinetochore-associated protein 3 isoform X2 n=1 Tax=Anomaloglossus baeobatrachus TaxID=238106 RepID=UPI003F4F64B0
MSVTVNFFSKLRHLALTLEKETAQLEQVFSHEDNDYEDESPMRVLHDLRSDIMSMKSDIQATIDKNETKGQELNSFIKICKVLQQRNASDIQLIKDTFQKYGYNLPEAEEHDDSAEEVNSKSVEEGCQSADPPGLPPPPVMEKPAAWDLLRVPQLSDFGLSHYQLPVVWKPQIKEQAPEEKPKPLYQDIRCINVAKTPKYALCREEDFSQIQHFGISDNSANLNDDYTMALINKKKGSGPEKPEGPSKDIKNLLATPAHPTYKSDFRCVDSPLPPVFCTPGLKVLKKVGLNVLDEQCDTKHLESKADGTHEATSSSQERNQNRLDVYQSLQSSRDVVDSPRPPTFCTPGLKVQKKDLAFVDPEPSESKETSVVKSLDTPPIPSFETKWLKNDTIYNVKLASPPKVSEYEKLLWTPTRPEMTSISQILARYCENEIKPSWQKTSENKENRP